MFPSPIPTWDMATYPAEETRIDESVARPTETPTVPRKRDPARSAKSKARHQPRYAIVLHNDSLNGMDFVVGVLRKVFHYGWLKSCRLMLHAHFAGRCAIWTGSLEVAELKREQIRACGADPNMRSQGAQTLTVSIEPLPE